MMPISALGWVAIAALWISSMAAHRDGLKVGGVSTAAALALFYAAANQLWVTDPDGPVGPMILGGITLSAAACHLLYRFTAYGLAIALSLSGMSMLAGLALMGVIPINGGLSYWTAAGGVFWLSTLIVGAALWTDFSRQR